MATRSRDNLPLMTTGGISFLAAKVSYKASPDAVLDAMKKGELPYRLDSNGAFLAESADALNWIKKRKLEQRSRAARRGTELPELPIQAPPESDAARELKDPPSKRRRK